MEKHLLKITFCFLFLVVLSRVNAQELQFTYDAAGNQIERNFVCVNCTTFPVSLASSPVPEPASSTTSSNTNTKSTNTLDNRKVTAYPNPFTQVLKLKWDNDLKYYVSKIEAYSSKGVLIYKQEFEKTEFLSEDISIPFEKQVAGFYFIKALYSDGKQEMIKVVKIDR